MQIKVEWEITVNLEFFSFAWIGLEHKGKGIIGLLKKLCSRWFSRKPGQLLSVSSSQKHLATQRQDGQSGYIIAVR